MSGSDESPTRAKPARRRLLKVLASGGGAAVGMKTLPLHWTQPVLDSVALPAHAQASPESLSLGDQCNIDSLQTDADSLGTLTVTVSGAVIGDGDLGGIQIDIEGVLTESGTPVPATVENANATTAADGTFGPVDLTFEGPCLEEGDGGLQPANRDGVQITISSPDPRLDGEIAICTAGFEKCAVFFED